MLYRVAAVMVVLLAVSFTDALEKKPDDSLFKALKDADIVFTAKIGKVNPLAQTNSIPPSTFGEITFKDAKAMRGKVAETPKYNYTFREGSTKNLDLEAKDTVLVAVRQKGVSVIVAATEANLAIAKKASEPAK